MIKIKFRQHEATLNGDEWTCDDEEIADYLNWKTEIRPRQYAPRREFAIAVYIVELFKDQGAEIIYDSGAGKPRNEREYSPEEKMY